MNTNSNHTFHIPVMGLAFTVDSPVKVARFGISSVISLAEDRLIEMMRKHYSEEFGEKYQPIGPNMEDYRAKRITGYLNLLNQIINQQFTTLQAEDFGQGNEIDKYFEMLPTDSVLRKDYEQMLQMDCPTKKVMLQKELRGKMCAGSIDVNIMTKLDKSNPSPNGEVKDENSDAIAALRGYANSDLSDSSMVFSAGLNPRLFNYLEHCEDFHTFKKKVIVKVTDFRSALIQGKYLAKKYPESFDALVPEELIYSGEVKLTDPIENSPIDAGKLVLSPTRTYAPVIKKILEKYSSKEIHGMVHCSGGAQTKILHFIDDLHIIKDHLFPIPPLFKLIQEQSKTDWKEMYQVFNCGHRMELYVPKEVAEDIIAISKSFNIDAQIVGRVEASTNKKLTIESEFGKFEY